MERSPVYVAGILGPCYAVARRRFFAHIMSVNLAHTVMLARQSVISPKSAALILGALQRCKLEDLPREYDPSYEDLFFRIEAEIERAVGRDVSGNMHVAFSRNDLDGAIFRMALRLDLLEVGERIAELRQALHDLAAEHRDTIMPAHTHGQQAQPTTFAHYLLGVLGNLQRDSERLLGCWDRLNRSPMGAAALATTGFPIDRMLVADLLGFDGLVENSYDAVCAHDHMTEVAATLWVMGTNLSRFVHDLLLLATNEFDVLKLDDSLVQISSIMPQKRNPVALEHLRATLSRVCGRAPAVFQMTHNVPYGDINDVGDDLQPLLEELFDEVRRSLALLTESMRHVSINRALLLQRATEGYATTTELADTLMREGQLCFRTAHTVVARFVAVCRESGRGLAQATLPELDAEAIAVLGRPTGLTEASFRAAVDPVVFVARRSIIGGPAPAEVDRALQSEAHRIAHLHENLDQRKARLTAALLRLHEAADTLARSDPAPVPADSCDT
jgi:argininosuccinate lyase